MIWRGLSSRRQASTDGLMLSGGGWMSGHRERVSRLLRLKSRLPAMYGASQITVDAGGLMTYGADYLDSSGASHITWTES